MMKLKKTGYAQVEPNKLNAQYTKQIFASLPLDAAIAVCENGMVMAYDQEVGAVRFTAADETSLVGLVMNEIILEDSRLIEDRDYAMMNYPESNYQVAIAGCPRVYGLTKGDVFTTNAIMVETENVLPAVGTTLVAGTEGYWVAGTDASVVARVIKHTTMPDGQLAAKLEIVQA